MNNIQEAQLLRENRSALVAQLNNIGFSDVNDYTPISLIADYMKWAGGLRDLRLAVINKSTGAYTDYSEDEWNALSASAKASCVKLGIRIRAERQDFIISKENVLRSNGSADIPWAPNNSIDVKKRPGARGQHLWSGSLRWGCQPGKEGDIGSPAKMCPSKVMQCLPKLARHSGSLSA